MVTSIFFIFGCFAKGISVCLTAAQNANPIAKASSRGDFAPVGCALSSRPIHGGWHGGRRMMDRAGGKKFKIFPPPPPGRVSGHGKFWHRPARLTMLAALK
jgi:hypothetical protein